MGASGTTTVDFGAFPGSASTSVAVTGQTGILAGSLTEAWLFPVATADHDVDDHLVMSGGIKVTAGAPSAGVGFTIYAYAPDNAAGGGVVTAGVLGTQGDGILLYGLWTVAWVWN